MTPAQHTGFCEIREAFLVDPVEASRRVSADPSLREVRNGIGETVLHWLVVEDVIPAVQALIAVGAAVEITNRFGQTPLMEAAELGYVQMCELLLNHGADPRYISPGGETPLCHAARSGKLETLRLLLRQFPEEEPLQSYFTYWDLRIIFKEGGPVADELRRRGIQEDDSDE